ncbi:MULTISPECIES: ribonuclease III [unclassified Coleofasciculus]|uniref:ribonuclease III n=1 Tax=unclassified Coleofasciculus TaxID=2692782 RepID=UPI001880C4FB|nr:MULTISPECIES: ribonuclease III [unclassified Coleofasciculus]MBE9129520.1 ribonuclease III [Coleofasciculus sp. LEGE 07081]MBE9151365.1 ribonuclease III [Coleofasciculus sp. LEGE 07092]
MSELPHIQDQKLRLNALTHRSYVNENPDAGEDNERLEFLGDAVLGFVVGELLYKRYPDMSEAQLTRLRSNLVDEKQLSKFATQLGIGDLMRLGKGAIKEGGQQNPSLLSDTFEAYIAAYFMESGIEAVRQFVHPLFRDVADSIVFGQSDTAPKNLVDSKGRFQQWALAKSGKNPEYFIIDESGLDHAKEFTAEVRVNGEPYGKGKGRRKQDAEKRAAEAALKKFGIT